MRYPLRPIVAALLLVAIGALVEAADPPPLVKPVVPAGTAARIRLLMDGKNTGTFKAQIPKQKGKKGEAAEVTLFVGTMGSGTSVSIQQWKAWGFEVPANRMGVLPELVIPGAQVAPKPAKGRDVEFRITNIKVALYEAPGGDTGGLGSYLSLPLSALTGGADRAFEPRFHFADRFIELTAPAAALKKLNTGDATSPDPQVTADDKLTPAVVAMAGPVFTFVSVNGRTQYTRPTGKVEPVIALLEGGQGGSITMSVSVARGCGVDVGKGAVAVKVKELRFGVVTGSGIKGQKDFVLKDVNVLISPDEDSSAVWFGSAFVEEHFKDGVYGCGSDGVWRLHGRVKPDLLEDIKTRAAPKKP